MRRGLLVLLVLGTTLSVDVHADVVGRCAHQRDAEEKITACAQAAKSISNPSTLQWIYREWARGHDSRGDLQGALAFYQQSLIAEEREYTRREMSDLLRRLGAAQLADALNRR